MVLGAVSDVLELADAVVVHDIELDDDPGCTASLVGSTWDAAVPVSMAGEVVVALATSGSWINTVEITVSVVAGSVVGGSVTVLVVSLVWVTVRTSVLVMGAFDEPPSTGTTEYRAALL